MIQIENKKSRKKVKFTDFFKKIITQHIVVAEKQECLRLINWLERIRIKTHKRLTNNKNYRKTVKMNERPFYVFFKDGVFFILTKEHLKKCPNLPKMLKKRTLIYWKDAISNEKNNFSQLFTIFEKEIKIRSKKQNDKIIDNKNNNIKNENKKQKKKNINIKKGKR